MSTSVTTVTTFTLAEAAEKVGVSKMTLWREIDRGKLVAHKRGNHLVIFAGDLLEYVLAHRGGRGIIAA